MTVHIIWNVDELGGYGMGSTGDEYVPILELMMFVGLEI
eukprot:CAMPEP_0194113658 /NCGR_PEP_ID=MMETSP0150-20130528/17293_1 /TAXON_ID=122233 /ORGANISM="Chaetoceros debilis, Strain MM31A-1" /LENGTH=38 /DNA_ID= /DNA_START= /DNA_END= /DNA_ORIENTATION=